MQFPVSISPVSHTLIIMGMDSNKNSGKSSRDKEISTVRWIMGMAIATTFCVVYFFAPLYMACAVLALVFQFPSRPISIIIVSPLILSLLTKPMAAPWLVGMLKPMADYFDYQEAFEFTDEDIRLKLKEGKKYILAFQPHGVVCRTFVLCIKMTARMYLVVFYVAHFFSFVSFVCSFQSAACVVPQWHHPIYDALIQLLLLHCCKHPFLNMSWAFLV